MIITYSLIIPVHNATKTLPKSMNSVLAQTKAFDEIILVENNSTDASLQLCQQYEREHQNIMVQSTTKKGVSAARNLGMQQATGTFIMLLDADDALEPVFLETIDKTISITQMQADVYEYNFQHYFPNGNAQTNPFILPTQMYEGAAYLKTVLKCFHEEAKFMPWRFAYKRTTLIAKKLLFNEKILIFEDVVFMQQLLMSAVNIYVLPPDVLLHYFYHEQSLTQTTPKKFCDALLGVSQALTHQSVDQKQYLQELAAKVLDFTEFKRFYSNSFPTSKQNIWYNYRKLRCLINCRKIQRKLKN